MVIIENHKLIKLGNIYTSGGQNGNIYHCDGISPTISSGETNTKGNGGVGSNNAPKILININELQKDNSKAILKGELKLNREKLTMIELFSGIGAQIRGTDNTGLWDCAVVNTSDIDKDAMVSYAAVHCGLTNEMIDTYTEYPTREEMAQYLTDRNIGFDFKKNQPYDWFKLAKRKNNELNKYYLACILSHNLGDISSIKSLDYADFWTYSFPCFVEGTLVLTADGYKPIEEITSNDYVLTHTNTYHKVVKPMINEADKIYKVDTMCSEAIYTTENHPFYVRKKNNCQDSKTGKRWREFSTPEWVKAKNLSRDYYVGTAINQKAEIPIWNGVTFKWGDGRADRNSNQLSKHFNNKYFWYLIGRYIGDGWIRSGGGIIICANDDEIGQITTVLDNLNFNYNIVQEKNINKIHIAFKKIGEYCEQFGRGAANKHLTSDIFNLPVDLLKSFLSGYIDADGCFTQGLYKITSVSRELIYGIGQCVAKAYHRPFSIYFVSRPKTTVIEGRVVNQRDTYQITFKTETNTQDKSFYENGYIWSPINDISYEDYNGLVYNLEVENDNSYVVQNVIVHNCQDISVAGKQAGIEKGKTRSGLLYEVERLLETAVNNGNQPKYLLLENVKNLVGKKFKPQFDEWIVRLDELGYNTYWQVVNGKDCGIPQNRERCFAISIRKDIDSIKFGFAKCFDNGLRLKDLLEENVDEKYFLKTLGNFFMNYSLECEENGNGFRFKPHNPTKAETAFSVTTRAGGRMVDNYVSDHDISEEPFFEFNKKNIEAVNTASDGTARTIKVQYYKNGNTNFTRENGFGATGVADNFRIRKLTPTECWRLMGFEDNDVSRAKSIGMSDTALYKQAGNSIITNCISLIMEHLYKAQVDNTYICTDENFTQPQQK